MTVPVATDDAATPSVPDPAEDLPRSAASSPAIARDAREAATGICPYLASAEGSWRSALPTRDHRCTALLPPAPQPADKQRRHCLVAAHVECPTYRAARTARAAALAGGGDGSAIERAERTRRPIAHPAPVVLEPPRLLDQALRFRMDRAPGQIALVALMIVAFAVVAVARLSTSPAAAPSPSGPVAVASASPSPTPTATPTPTPSAGPSAEPSPSFRTTYTAKRGDTLSAIAKRFKTTVAAIKALNGLKSNSLKIGQVLKIP
jgi:hypothetical protein